MSQKISTFAKRLREALDERGMTQAALAQMSGISKSSISRYLSGAWEGKQDAVYALSKALNVNEAWLMGYDVTMNRGSAEVEQAGNIYEALNKEKMNPDIRMIARAGKKMTPEQAENLRKYAQYMFPEAFEDDD